MKSCASACANRCGEDYRHARPPTPQSRMKTGMSKKPIEVLAKEVHYEPLPEEVRVVIIAAWTRGGLLPKSTVERMIPAQIRGEPIDAAAAA
jgi:hypothetical protein